MSIDCYCDYETPTIYRSDTRRAKKRYGCEECSGEIFPGEIHEYHFGMCDGNSYFGRTCIHCVEIRRWVTGNIPCFCWAHGNMMEDARNAIDEAVYRAREETVGLKFGFLRRVFLRDKFNASHKLETV